MYRWSVCDPLVNHVIEKGTIPNENILSKFREFPWADHLEKMQSADQREIYFSPSLEFEEVTTQRAIIFSAVGERDDFVFYVFYKRPERVKKFFGLFERDDPAYLSEIYDQSFESAFRILEEFATGNYDTVSSYFS